MAAVTYECNRCKHFWHGGMGDECPKCGSGFILFDWDENPIYDLPDEDEKPDDDIEEDEDDSAHVLSIG